MLVFPKRMLAGDVPNVDFLHLYGPGSLHVLMLWYKVFGYTLEARAHLRAAATPRHRVRRVRAVPRPWGHRLATVAAVTVTLLVHHADRPVGPRVGRRRGARALEHRVRRARPAHVHGRERLLALGATGGAGRASRSASDPTSSWRSGMALVVVHLADGPWRSGRQPILGGAVVGGTPMWIHLAVAGIPARRGAGCSPTRSPTCARAAQLPRPPSFGKVDGALQAVVEGPADAPWWRFPALAANHQLFFWFWLVVA